MNEKTYKYKKDYIANNCGMMTLEAVVIIPITLAIFILLVWLGFYFYNKNALAGAAAEAALYGTENSQYSNEEIKNLVEDRLKECITNKTVLMDNIDYEIEVGFTEIVVSLSGNIKVPLSVMYGGIYGTEGWSINTIKRSPRLKNSSFIRMVKIAGGN